jgi:hypothetical protein
LREVRDEDLGAFVSGTFGRLFRENVIGWLGTMSSAPSQAVSPEAFFAVAGATGLGGDFAGLRVCPRATTDSAIRIASSKATHAVNRDALFCVINPTPYLPTRSMKIT